MTEDDKRAGLRIGGWLPPYRDTPGPDGLPLRPAPPAGQRRVGPLPGFPGAGATGPRRRTLVLAGAAAAVAGILMTFALVDRHQPGPLPPPGERLVLPLPSAAVSVLPAPTPSRASTTVATARISHDPVSRNRPVPTRRSPAPVVDLVIGSTVGLELHGRPGDRVRHRDFVARVEHLGAGSSDLDRADSRFTVRKGLGRPGCASLEAVNFPGYFLRHRNFVIHLDRRDRSHLFDQDATFCPAPTRSGAALTLESLNYPGRFVVARDGGLRLDETAAAAATAFVVTAPL